MTKSKNTKFISYSERKRKPVELFEKRLDMISFAPFKNQTCSAILHTLKAKELIRSYTREARVTVIKSGSNRCMYQGSSRFFRKKWTDG